MEKKNGTNVLSLGGFLYLAHLSFLSSSFTPDKPHSPRHLLIPSPSSVLEIGLDHFVRVVSIVSIVSDATHNFDHDVPLWIKKTRPGGQRCVLKPLFHFFFFYNFFIFHSPRRSFLLVTPSSSSLLVAFKNTKHCSFHSKTFSSQILQKHPRPNSPFL